MKWNNCGSLVESYFITFYFRKHLTNSKRGDSKGALKLSSFQIFYSDTDKQGLIKNLKHFLSFEVISIFRHSQLYPYPTNQTLLFTPYKRMK